MSPETQPIEVIVVFGTIGFPRHASEICYGDAEAEVKLDYSYTIKKI
jgi:hypothetical protein